MPECSWSIPKHFCRTSEHFCNMWFLWNQGCCCEMCSRGGIGTCRMVLDHACVHPAALRSLQLRFCLLLMPWLLHGAHTRCRSWRSSLAPSSAGGTRSAPTKSTSGNFPGEFGEIYIPSASTCLLLPISVAGFPWRAWVLRRNAWLVFSKRHRFRNKSGCTCWDTPGLVQMVDPDPSGGSLTVHTSSSAFLGGSWYAFMKCNESCMSSLRGKV